MTTHDRARMRGVVAALCAGLLAAVGVPSAAVGAPTDDDVRAARRAVAQGQDAVARLEVELAGLAAARDSADVEARAAAEAYLRAEADRAAAEAAAAAAVERSRAAGASMAEARRTLVAIAVQAGRSGGPVEGVQAFLSADGFDDMVERSAVLTRMGGKADAAVQTFRATRLVARTLEGRAARAVSAGRAAADDAQRALRAAERAEDEARAAVAAAESERESIVVQLAAARATSADVERARQDQVDAQRAARADAAAQARNASAAASAAASTRPAAGTTSAAPAPAPAAPAPAPAPAPPAPTSARAPVPAPAPAPAPGPAPAAAPGPAPAPAPPAPPAAPAPAPPPAPAPAPAPPPAPAPAPGGLGTGTSRGSAGQGAAAVAWAMSNLGLEYVLGANGPTQYDCSSFTGAAWRSAGVNLPRTSRDQYQRALKIDHASMRPGDLIFWGRDAADPSSIHHVAMYAGNGQVVEASRPGVPTRLASMAGRWHNTMPFAGRP